MCLLSYNIALLACQVSYIFCLIVSEWPPRYVYRTRIQSLHCLAVSVTCFSTWLIWLSLSLILDCCDSACWRCLSIMLLMLMFVSETWSKCLSRHILRPWQDKARIDAKRNPKRQKVSLEEVFLLTPLGISWCLWVSVGVNRCLWVSVSVLCCPDMPWLCLANRSPRNKYHGN